MPGPAGSLMLGLPLLEHSPAGGDVLRGELVEQDGDGLPGDAGDAVELFGEGFGDLSLLFIGLGKDLNGDDGHGLLLLSTFAGFVPAEKAYHGPGGKRRKLFL